MLSSLEAFLISWSLNKNPENKSQFHPLSPQSTTYTSLGLSWWTASMDNTLHNVLSITLHNVLFMLPVCRVSRNDSACRALVEKLWHAADESAHELPHPLIPVVPAGRIPLVIGCPAEASAGCDWERNSWEASLPDSLNQLVEACQDFRERGHVLVLDNVEQKLDTWIILDQTTLLCEVTGILFAPDNFKQHHPLAGSTGVILFIRLQACFFELAVDTSVIIQILCHLECCQEVSDLEVLKLLEADKSSATGEQFWVMILQKDCGNPLESTAITVTGCFKASRTTSAAPFCPRLCSHPSGNWSWASCDPATL